MEEQNCGQKNPQKSSISHTHTHTHTHQQLSALSFSLGARHKRVEWQTCRADGPPPQRGKMHSSVLILKQQPLPFACSLSLFSFLPLSLPTISFHPDSYSTSGFSNKPPQISPPCTTLTYMEHHTHLCLLLISLISRVSLVWFCSFRRYNSTSALNHSPIIDGLPDIYSVIFTLSSIFSHPSFCLINI